MSPPSVFQFAPVHHDDHHSETSAETVGSDSGRGGSEEDEVTSSPSAGQYRNNGSMFGKVV